MAAIEEENMENDVNVSIVWTNTKIEMLIENVKKYKVLFDVTYKEYKNKSIKENAWKKVADELEFPVHIFQTKWKGLRDTFTENVRREKLPSGSGRKKVIRWRWFEHMQFVRDCISHRTSSSNIGFVPTYSENEGKACPEKGECSEIELPLQSSSTLPLEVSSPEVSTNNKTSTEKLDLKRMPSSVHNSPIKKKKNVDQEVDIALLKLLKEDKSSNVGQSETDAEASFGNSIAHTLRSFDNYQKALAKMKITEVLFQVECGLPLTEN
ncbi:transcription factor Adf-1-like [Dendronephthya gigantea]|uniref:transcription factor Adf-1-like n=1 Tax=Dendronephthya gigantea TaxID=151771 RepID=UPI00106C3C58|nr:transcription factor Adf-1-like [Dendronephthya gigantea]